MNALQTLISVLLLAFLALGAYNWYRVDHLRQELFEIRDRLFDEAADGHIGFASPAYRATRSLLNGSIRYAHRMSVSRFFAFHFMVAKHAQPFALRMGSSSKEEQGLCRKYVEEANLCIAHHLTQSIFFLPVAIPLLCLFVLSDGMDLAHRFLLRWRKQFAVLDEVVYREGSATSKSPHSRFAL